MNEEIVAYSYNSNLCGYEYVCFSVKKKSEYLLRYVMSTIGAVDFILMLSQG